MNIPCGKIRHATKNEATSHLVHLRKMNHSGHNYTGDIGVYMCCQCGYWHVGHTKRNKKYNRKEKNVLHFHAR